MMAQLLSSSLLLSLPLSATVHAPAATAPVHASCGGAVSCVQVHVLVGPGTMVTSGQLLHGAPVRYHRNPVAQECDRPARPATPPAPEGAPISVQLMVRPLQGCDLRVFKSGGW